MFLTKAGTGKGIQLEGFNYRDPFEAVSSFQGILGEDETKTTKKKTSEKDEAPSSFFRIGLGEDEEEDFDYKSKRADSILGEFTSMFKGFK